MNQDVLHLSEQTTALGYVYCPGACTPALKGVDHTCVSDAALRQIALSN